MKVCLIAPPNPSMVDPRIAPPLGLLYLVAWARKEGWDTSDWTVVDLNTACYQPDAPVGHWTHDFSLARCMAEIPTGCEVYGVSLASMQLPHGRAIAKALREREPGALLVCGGSHASAVPEECVDPEAMFDGHFDVAIEREGEAAFLALLNVLAKEGILYHDAFPGLREVPRGHCTYVATGRPVEPLDDLPFPARDLLDWSLYTRRIAGEAATNIITTRGCPARCTFCQQDSLWGGNLRMQCAERILAEVDHIRETTGIRNLLFLDDSLTARKRSDMYRLCAGLKERGVLWRGWTRANLCVRPGDADVLRAMADSGCQAICIGVEAGTDKVLKAMDKETSVEVNRRAIKAVAEAGMDCRVSIMVGNPQETWADVQALVDFIEEMSPWLSDWILSSYVPLPGTPSWDHPERYGFAIDKGRARAEGYRHFFVVGGSEQSGMVHTYLDGTGPEDIQRRHDFVQESLLRLAPRERKRVTIGATA